MAERAPEKILLVDDLEENLLALEALLRREGVACILARSGEQALELLLEHDVALALLDVQMPGMDGFELAELMRGNSRTKNVPIIFVTAGAHDMSRIFKGYEAGAVDFLHKPIEPRVLRNKIDTFVGMHRKQRQLAEQLELVAQREREAAELRDRLERTLQLQETFVAAIGHDLRNPLSTIMMAVPLLQRGVTDARLSKILGRVGSSTRRMATMLDELGDLARARVGGGMTVSPEPDVDLHAIAETVVGDAKTAYPDCRFLFTHEGDVRGTWDRRALDKILGNFLSNAARHGKKDQPIEVRVVGDGSRVQLSVTNGGEVPRDVLPIIFEPFRRSKSASQEGLGLGLFIVRQLALAHGGDVSVESHDGKTTFMLTLPRAC